MQKKYIEDSVAFLNTIPFIPYGNHYNEVDEHLSHPFLKYIFPKL